jgi:zinc/manganese transport system permease protein
MLRRMSLTADVLSHGALPGVAVAFLIAGLSVPALWFGGLVAGLLVAVGAGALARVTGGREDATLAALYLLALGLGVALISIGGGAGDLKHILFGSVLGVDDAALLLMAGVATLTLVMLAIGWRPLVLECFDPAFAAATGAHGGFWHLVFMGLVVLNMLSAFLALGTLMAVGLMMLPAIAARHWAAEIGGMVYAASAIAVFASVIGLLLSYHADLPSGPAIVLMAGLAWAISVMFGPVDGLAQRVIRRRHLAG